MSWFSLNRSLNEGKTRCIQSVEGGWSKAWRGLKHVPLSALSVRNHSALDPLRVLHSRSRRRTAPCSLHFKRYQWVLRERKHVAHCCSAEHQKSSPASANNIVTPLGSFTVGFLAENTEQNLNVGAGLRLLIIIILIPTGSDRMHHICTCFWFLSSLTRS